MSVLNLALAKSEADALFNQFRVKADGSTENTYIHTADFVFPIANTAEAAVLAELIPGAKDMYLRASQEDTNWKTSVTVTPEIRQAHFELADAKSGRVVFKGAGEILTGTLRASKRETKLTVRVAFGGQTAETSMAFTRLLRSNVHVIYEGAQQTMFQGKKGEARPVPAIGDIVCGIEDGTTVFGRAVEVNDEDAAAVTVIVNDFGTEHVFDIAGVKSFWKPAEVDFEKCTKSFSQRCKKRGLIPSWSALTQAVGEAFADGTPSEGAHTLTTKIVERAIELLSAKAPGGAAGDGTGEGEEEVPREGGSASSAPVRQGGPTALA